MARGGRGGSDINPNFLCVSSAGLRYERCRCQISLICRHLFSWSHHKQQVMWFYLRMLLKQQPWNANEGWNNNCLCREEPTHISEVSQGVNNLEAVILSIFEANVEWSFIIWEVGTSAKLSFPISDQKSLQIGQCSFICPYLTFWLVLTN